MTGPVGRVVELVANDPRWPRQSEEERARIRAAMGSRVLAVEHIGSTAVPDLAAKPIIDILAGVRHLEDVREIEARARRT